MHLGTDVYRTPWKPISEETVLAALEIILDPSSYPLAVMCSQGRHRTGIVVGCLRKLQGWNLTAILEEYRHYAGTKIRLINEQFIDLFDLDLVNVPRNAPKCLRLEQPKNNNNSTTATTATTATATSATNK